jgi:hypothetical protein
MNPVVVSRNESECVLIEGSINSVRISVKVKKADDLEDFLAKKFMRCVFYQAFCSARGAGFRFKFVMFQQTGTIPVANCDLPGSFRSARRALSSCEESPLRCAPPCAAARVLSRPRHTFSGLRHFVFDHQLPHGSHVSDAVLCLLLDFSSFLTLNAGTRARWWTLSSTSSRCHRRASRLCIPPPLLSARCCYHLVTFYHNAPDVTASYSRPLLLCAMCRCCCVPCAAVAVCHVPLLLCVMCDACAAARTSTKKSVK